MPPEQTSTRLATSTRAPATPWKPDIKLLRMSDVEPVEMQWLWHPYVPMGSASMLFGPGGLGKSHIACDIAARVASGRALPGQKFAARPRKVLLMTAEDDPEAVLHGRLIAAGADMTNIFVPDASFVLNERGIKTMCWFMQDAAATVVFIDPVVSYMGGKIDMNKMNEVRTLTGSLHAIAQKTNSAVIIVHHSRKGTEGEDYEKAAGSADFNNAVRSVLFVSRDKAGFTYLNHVKSNYSKLGPAIPYELDKEDAITWGEPIKTQLYTGSGRKRAEAQAWIRAALNEGPRPAKELVEEAEALGFNIGTLNRAKEGVAESYLIREGGVNVWWWRPL